MYSTIKDQVAIEVNNVSKDYILSSVSQPSIKGVFWPTKSIKPTKFSALKNINFNLLKGQTLGIIGRNGSGKSTLLQIICGVLSATEGRVRTNGRIAAMLELGTGFNTAFTGRENIMFTAALLGLTKSEILERFEEIEKFADIGSFFDQPVRTYSSGMYSRLAFAVSINISPDILVIDEALAVGDEVFQRKCFARIEEMKERGVTILFVSHSGGSIISLCDRTILLHQGRLVFDGAPKRGVYYLQKIGNAHHNEVEDILQEMKDEQAEAIKNKINSLSETSNLLSVQKKNKSPSPALSSEENNHISSDVGKSTLQEFYDPSLKANTASSYTPRGATISSTKLTTLQDESVNHVISGKRYKLKVKFEFSEDCEQVRAYVLMRTTQGMDLAGYAYPSYYNSSGFNAKKGSEVEINFEFDCMLNEGEYQCSFALQAQDGSLHHRLVDALVFRVFRASPSISTGLIDLNYTVKIEASHERQPLDKSLKEIDS